MGVLYVELRRFTAAANYGRIPDLHRPLRFHFYFRPGFLGFRSFFFWVIFSICAGMASRIFFIP